MAPVLDQAPAHLRPWHIVIGEGRIIAVNLAGTLPTERLLEQLDVVAGDALVCVRHAARAIIG